MFVISNKMEKDIIKKIIIENQQRIPGLPVLKRDYSAEPSANYIITGQRRAGKTWFIFSILQDMIAAGLPSEAVLHINFEDERLIGTGVNDLETIMESYFELFTHTPVKYKTLKAGRNLPAASPTRVTGFISRGAIRRC